MYNMSVKVQVGMLWMTYNTAQRNAKAVYVPSFANKSWAVNLGSGADDL